MYQNLEKIISILCSQTLTLLSTGGSEATPTRWKSAVSLICLPLQLI